MRPGVLLTLLAVGCGASPPAVPVSAAPAAPEADAPSEDPSGVVFGRSAPKVGTVFLTESQQTLRVELEQRQGKQKVQLVQASSQRTKTRITILAVSGTAVTREKVEYLEGRSEQRLGDRVQDVPSPLVGKTYVLEARQGSLRATGADGAPVSDYESERLAQNHPNLGRPSGFIAILPDRPLTVGERLTPDAGALADAFGKRGVEVRDASLVLESAGEGVGQFAVSFVLIETRENTTTETTLGGSVMLQADTSWPLETKLRGPVRVTGPDELSGAGEVSIEVHTSAE
jgi:hypothetical protein